MTRPRPTPTLEQDWARLGVLLNCIPAGVSPDPERLLLDTARRLGRSPHLAPLVVTWLADHSGFVARHRLARLVVRELLAEHHPALALLLEEAIRLGATGELRIVTAVCRAAACPGPLFETFRADPALVEIARRNASPTSLRWGAWTPQFDPKHDAIRPVSWILDHNPSLAERIVRKGDLRCSILASLRYDADGRVDSASQLARLCGGTRAGVRRALTSLIQEGLIRILPNDRNARDHAVVLRSAA